jgi:hypothetical protein
MKGAVSHAKSLITYKPCSINGRAVVLERKMPEEIISVYPGAMKQWCG